MDPWGWPLIWWANFQIARQNLGGTVTLVLIPKIEVAFIFSRVNQNTVIIGNGVSQDRLLEIAVTPVVHRLSHLNQNGCPSVVSLQTQHDPSQRDPLFYGLLF